jgi:hypothetical protein
MRDELARPDRRIAVAGAFKTGKSALLNALLGAPMLPVRARRPSRRVAEIRHGDIPTALVRTGSGERSEIPFDATGDAILAGDPADTVEIRVPLPLLAGGCVLTDTPGLGEEPSATTMALAAVADADLAIVVLAADKILSANERAAAAEITGLLAGNVLYAVNRLDLIEAEDRAEILEWAGTVLASSGNALVGRPRIFGTVARGPDSAGVDELRDWLTQAQESGLLDRIAAVSRLARLQRSASAAATALGTDAAGARTHAEDLRRRHDEQAARRRAQLAERMGSARASLAALLPGLGEQEDAFVERCVDDTITRLQAARDPVPLQVHGAMDAWVKDLTASVRDILADAPVTAPPFSLEDWIVRIQVERPADTPDAIGGQVGEVVTRLFDGGRAGRETGAAIGSWIGKTVLGVDAQAERRKRIERAAGTLLPSLRVETERYLARVVVLLDEAERYYAGREEPDPDLEAAEQDAEQATALFHWAGALVQESDRLRTTLLIPHR